MVHHVNVITGNLNLSFQDSIARGAVSIPLIRTYSSAGALESEREQIHTKIVRGGWIPQGGWNVLSHVNLILEPHLDRKEYKAYVSEPGGNLVAYKYSHKEHATKYTVFLKPDRSISQTSGPISARTNPQNNLLRIDLKIGEAILFLPDGGRRIYRGPQLHHYKGASVLNQVCYHLETEILPSKHQFRYWYDQTILKKIEAKNPADNKTYSSITFDCFLGDKKKSFHVKAKTSDQNEVNYLGGRYEERDYIHVVDSTFRPTERDHLTRGRKGIGARITSIDLGGKEQFKVRYFQPHDKKHEKKWSEHPQKKHFYIDKVQSLLAAVGPLGEEIEIARFTYGRRITTVIDSDGLITKYYHDGNRLNDIIYLDEKAQNCSIQKFYWTGSHLSSKAMYDTKNTTYRPLFAKTFCYEGENVVEETLWGHLTGNDVSDLQIDSTGRASGAECYIKRYAYYTDHCNLLKSVCEDEGPLYEYIYKPDTDLIAAKFTKDQKGQILIREFYVYDEDNLLVQEIIDNGITTELNDLTQVTQRLQKYTERYLDSGLPETITESYWDPLLGQQKLLKKSKLTYLNQKVIEEAVYDADGLYRYTIYTDYDEFGNIARQTNPLGQNNTYRYNQLGLLEESKEIGSSKKIYAYDKANRKISSLDTDSGISTYTSYDAKDRILSQTDARGNTTTHSYDAFGNLRRTTLPKDKDEQGRAYEPIIALGYDAQGNLTSSTKPLGETTQTFYNLLRKPIRIIQPDGTEIRHFYQRNGVLAKTMYPDGTEDYYTYDLFQRITSKNVLSSTRRILSTESWEYDAFQLRSYTDSRGLITRFFYDGSGRKISEEAEDRKITFTYDSLGFLERTDNGIIVSVQKHNVAGLVEEQWEEDTCGRIENRMRFTYDEENRKKTATRVTSQGEAVDLFSYKNGKLIRHTDPRGAVTQFIYDETYINDLDQKVLRKTVIDPLGNQTIETYDAGDRLVCQEKKDSHGSTVFKEEYLYDRSGNRSKRISYVYLEGHVSKAIAVDWEYDPMGRVKKETEAGQKTTVFQYDLRGFPSFRILPSGIQIATIYDGLGRLIEQYSSDKAIHDQYIYAQGPDPIQIIDRIQGTTIQRVYNHFGDIIREMNMNGLQTSWRYDSIGRCISMTLPDGSSIDYPCTGAHVKAVQRKAPDGRLLYEHTYHCFDPNGHVEEEHLIFNLGSIQTMHDLLERPTNQSSPWLDHSIAYGSSGLVTATQNSLFGSKKYEHDALNQLIVEGEKTYAFDSLGNPEAYEINDLNQIISTADCQLLYDADGYPREKIFAHQRIAYVFDPRGRLIEITVHEQRKTRYSYDSLSRLFAKETYQWIDGSWEKERKLFYLYDREKEIGAVDEKGHFVELRVLGLGIKGDIGAAVAIEIADAVYVPLHDFGGNVIAIISSDGKIAETYEIDAFGKESVSHPPINPWRFCSKRSEEGLIFFGLRFYDPSLGRWLTPDPAGFTDGPNLYAYVQNSPLSRLDLFGLFGEDAFGNHKPFEMILSIPSVPMNNRMSTCIRLENGSNTEYFICGEYWHQLQFTPHEIESGSYNLFNHPEIGGPRGMISLVTTTHGINTTREEFLQTCESISKQLPGTLFIGRYYGTDGILSDGLKTSVELCNIETREVVKAQQFYLACSQFVQKINPAIFDNSGGLQSLGSLWLHIPHSRGGAVTLRALQSMPYEQKRVLQTQLLITAIAPALPISMEFGLEVLNFYSTQDGITGCFGVPTVPGAALGSLIGARLGGVHGGIVGAKVGKAIANHFFDRSDCDIRIVPCVSKWSERTFGADHAIMGGTYRGVVRGSIEKYNTIHGFYDGKTR